MSERDKLDREYEQTVIDLGIPPCPQILIDISAEVRKAEPDLQRIERLISEDVGLSAALIKTINSPFYGLRNKVHSVMQAIHMLGLSQLSLMVTALVLRDVLKGLGTVDMGRFWDASSKVAIISSYIAGRLPYIVYENFQQRSIDKDEAYTYGLFQDCGIPIMLNQFASYKETLGVDNLALDRKFTEVEDAEYGQNHAMVGYILARSWGLPEAMYQAIRLHHEHASLAHQNFISDESRDLIAVSLLAERAIQLITDLNHTCEWQKGGHWVMQHFGINEADIASIVKGIRILYEEGNLNG